MPPIILLTFGLFMLCLALAMVLSFAFTGAARALALRWGVLSHVTGRSSHAIPTPRLGGLGLALGFAAAAGLFLGALRWLGLHYGTDPESHAFLGYNPRLVLWLAFGWGGMLATGLADDAIDLPATLKLMLMTIAALFPVIGGGLRFAMGQPGWMPTDWFLIFNGALALGWILFFANAFNFMDGMDGFAAGFARVAATTLFLAVFVWGLIFHNVMLVRGEAYLLPILAMACWGFLLWNRPPAKIFMGDGGSLPVGYLLAIFPLLGDRGGLGLRIPWLVSTIILLPFLFDSILTMILRLSRGENLLKAHRSHLYQRLMRSGLSHAEVLQINRKRFLACAALALAGQFLGSGLAQWLAFAAAFAVMLQYWRLTLRREAAMAGIAIDGKPGGA